MTNSSKLRYNQKMKLTIILGPMKSGKSFDLISFFSPLKYTATKYVLYQPKRNVRDEGIESRSGLTLEAKKIETLEGIADQDFSIIGIDEMHMFEPSEISHIEKALAKGKEIIISGLDMDYKGEMFDTIKRLLELGPTEVRYKRAVCNECKQFSATHTQVYDKGAPITHGMPPVIPDDGTFSYEPVCRLCFARE